LRSAEPSARQNGRGYSHLSAAPGGGVLLEMILLASERLMECLAYQRAGIFLKTAGWQR